MSTGPETSPRPRAAQPFQRTTFRLRSLSQRLDGTAKAYEVLKSIQPNHPQLAQFSEQAWGILEAVDVAKQKDPASAEFFEALDEVEAKIRALEEDLLKMDSAIPNEVFETRLARAKPSFESLICYAALLGRFIASAPDRPQRLLHVATLLLVRPQADGTEAVISFEDSELALRYIAGDVIIGDESKDSGESFLRSASARLAEQKTVGAIFDSEFFFDVHGFILCLKQALLAPEILSGVIRLRAALNNRILHLAKLEEVPAGILAQRIQDERDRITQIFRHAPKEVAQRFEWAKKERASPRWRPRNWEEYMRHVGGGGALTAADVQASKYRRIALGVAAALVIALGGRHIHTWLSIPRMVAMSPGDVADVHSLLVSGAIPDTVDVRNFVGELDSNRWFALSTSDRSAAAERIANRLAQRGIRAASISALGSVAIQVEDGKVMFVR